MTEEEIDKQIRQLQAEKAKIERAKEKSELGEHAKTILTKGSIDENKLFEDLVDGYLPKDLYYNLSWRDVKYKINFVYGDIKYVYDYSEDDGRVHKFYIKKINDERFTLEELGNLIPEFDELLNNKIKQMENHLDGLRGIQCNEWDELFKLKI
jgi:hypothetical protein